MASANAWDTIRHNDPLAPYQHGRAESILRDGFRDTHGCYLTDREFSGVWFSDRPLDSNEGAWGNALLRVEIACTESEISEFEWIEEGKAYREWLIPAAFVNPLADVSLTEDE
jgi:hypothetical protein